MHCCNINKSRRGDFFSVHLVYQKFSIAPPGRTWHNDEFRNAIVRKFSKHIFAFLPHPVVMYAHSPCCSEQVGSTISCRYCIAFVAMYLVSSFVFRVVG